MEENNKIIMMSLFSMVIAIVFFVFGLSMGENIILIVCEYIFAALLLISSFLALKNKYKYNKKAIYMYLLLLNLGIFFIITYALLSKIGLSF